MKKREKNRLLNEIIDLRKVLREKETLLKNAILEDKEDVSTSKGMAEYRKEVKQMRFNLDRFKETSFDIYQENLVETIVKEHIKITEKK